MPTTTGRATDFITFSRTSNATVTDSNGFIKWAGHNLLTNSESFDASAWTKSNAPTVTANSTVAPDGTTTADTIAASSVNLSSSVFQNVTLPVCTAVLQFYVRAGTATQLGAGVFSGGFAASTSQIISGPGSISGSSNITITGLSTTVWTLVRMTVTIATAGTYSILFYPDSGEASGKSVILWGAHLYRSDLGGMVLNPARGDAYYPTTPPNLLGYSNFTTGWTTQLGAVITPNNIASPDGLNTGARIALGADALSAAFQNVTGFGTYTVSAWLRGDVGGETVKFAYYNATNGLVQSSAITLTNAWVRYSWTASPTASSAWYITNTAATAKIVYAWGAQLSDSASLDAYSPVYGAAVTSAAYYAPRLDFDPVTLAARGLLVEELRTNLLTYSQAIGSAPWSAYGTATAGTTTASPDGSSNGQLITVPTAGNGWTSDVAIVSASTTYTTSIYVKASIGTQITFFMRYYNSGVPTGSTTTTQTITSGVLAINGFYRLSITEATPSSTNQAQLAFLAVNNGDAWYLYGAQLEAGSFATSYIPTGAATATRTADVASVSTQAFPYSASASTLVANVSLLSVNTAGFKGLAAISDGTANNRIALYQAASATSAWQIVSSGGASQANITPGNVSANTPFKLGTAVASNDAAAYLGGVAGTPDPTVTMPAAATIMYIGGNASGGEPLNGWVRQITYLPRRLPNPDLAARTV